MSIKLRDLTEKERATFDDFMKYFEKINRRVPLSIRKRFNIEPRTSASVADEYVRRMRPSLSANQLCELFVDYCFVNFNKDAGEFDKIYKRFGWE